MSEQVGVAKIEITFDLQTRQVHVSFPQDEMVAMYMMQKAHGMIVQQLAALSAPKIQPINGNLRPFRPNLS